MQRVAMLVRNDVHHDARVQREAAALRARYQVTVYGLDGGVPYASDKGSQVRLLQIPRRRWASIPGSGFASYIGFAARAIVALTRAAPDVVHAHDLDALLPCAIVAARLRIPLIYDAHELYAEQGRHGWLGRTVLRALEDVAMLRAAAVLAANESRAEVMWREYRVPSRPVAIINCPESTSTTIVSDGRLRRWVTVQGRRWDRIVVYEGALLQDRHLCELARAARLMPAGIGVVFVGAGPAEEAIRREGGERVLVHPLLPIEELLPFVAGADVGVVTYANTCRNNYLCAPNKLFDYARAGLAVAVGDLPELARMVTDFDAGVTFRNGDVDSMAREIAALASDEIYLHRARRGAQRIAQRYTWESEAAKLLRVYEDALEA